MNGGEGEDVSCVSVIRAGNTVLDRRVVLWPQQKVCLWRCWCSGPMNVSFGPDMEALLGPDC